nr:translation initiation factor IF-2-like isoform X2 [Equus asinus]
MTFFFPNRSSFCPLGKSRTLPSSPHPTHIHTPENPRPGRGISVLAADSLSRGNIRVGEALSPSGPRKERMENSLTPRPPRGPGWGADSRTRGGRGPPSPPAAGRRGRPKRRGPERTWAQVVGARQRREGAGGSPARARDPRQLHRSGAQGFAAVCRPPWGCPVHVASLGAGGPGPAAAAASCSLLLRLLLLLPGLLHSPPPAAPLAGSQSPPPGARGAGGRRLPPAGVQQGWAEARQGCGAVGRALDRGACVATALQRRPRPPRSRARAPPPPHRAERQARVNELDFGYLERGGLPCTLSTRAHRHTHTPPPKSGFPQGMGGEEVVAKAVQTMERGKVASKSFLTSLKKKKRKVDNCDTEEAEKAAAAPGGKKQPQTQDVCAMVLSGFKVSLKSF